MKFPPVLKHIFLFLSSLTAAGFTADVAPPLPAGDVQIRIQGAVQLQLAGGTVRLAGAQQKEQATRILSELRVIFFPGIPTVLLPNPAAPSNAMPGYLGVVLETEANGPGVGIVTVTGDSPAQKAGLAEGDRVLKFEGKEAKDMTQLREMIRAAKAGEDVKMAVRRDGKEIEIKAKLGAAPDAVAGVQMLQMNGVAIGEDEPKAVPGVVVFRDKAIIPGIVVAGKTRPAQSPGYASTAPTDSDSVLLRDGNRFAGNIRGITPEKGLQLQRDGLADLELSEEEITRLTFAEREKETANAATKEATAQPKVQLQLRDGSAFHGDALTMEHDRMRLILPGGQQIEIPREQAQSLALSDGESVQIYDGPTGLSGWSSGRSNQGQWEYKDGVLRCMTNGPIGRDLGHMPDPVEFSFDVIYPPHAQHFGVSLFSGSPGQTSPGSLTLQFSPGQIRGYHYDGRRSNSYNENFGQQAAAFLSVKPEAVRYRVLVDRVNGKALIYVGGEKRADWKLSTVKPEEIGKCGGAFSLTPNISMSGSTFTLGRVRVMPWDGKEPANQDEPPAPKGDRVLSGDGKVADGTIERITDDEVIFAKPGTSARRAGSLVVRFAAPADAKEFSPPAATVRMKNGSEFAAAKVRGNGETFTITTRYDQEIALPLKTLRELEFLPRAGQAEISARSLDVFTLTDGTQWKGKAILPVGGDTVHWKIAASKTPLDHPSAKVAGILFSRAGDPDKSPVLTGSNAVTLGNGDWLPGDVVSLDGKQLVLKTTLVPELLIPLPTLRGIYLNPAVVATLSDGATGASLWSEGWKPNQYNLTRETADTAAKTAQPWSYHDGGYALTGQVRSNQPILAQRWPAFDGAYALNFAVTNPSAAPSFNVQLFNAKDERTFTISANGGRVFAYFNSTSVRMNRIGGGMRRLQVEQKMDNASGGTTRVAIVLDRPAKTFRIFMDGKEIGKIPFKEDEAKEALEVCAMSLTIYSYTTGGKSNRVTSLWLAPWEGANATAAAAAGSKDPEQADGKVEIHVPPTPSIHLANGDEFSGTITKLTTDLVAVDSEAGPLELPGKRVAWIHFPGEPDNAKDHFPRLRFRDRGLLSVQNLQIGNDRVKCQTLQGQPLDFPLSLVKEIIWHPLDGK